MGKTKQKKKAKKKKKKAKKKAKMKAAKATKSIPLKKRFAQAKAEANTANKKYKKKLKQVKGKRKKGGKATLAEAVDSHTKTPEVNEMTLDDFGVLGFGDDDVPNADPYSALEVQTLESV